MIYKNKLVLIIIFIIISLALFFMYKTYYNSNSIDVTNSDDMVLLSYVETRDGVNLKLDEESTDIKTIDVDEESVNFKVLDVDEGNTDSEVLNLDEENTDSFDLENNEETISVTYYVRSPFNVFLEPDKNSSLIETVSINDPINILEETEEWAKIRILHNGLEGYTFNKSYSLEKMDYINNVPFLNQVSLGYPTGCEAVSATMVARFEGYDVDIETIVNNTPTDSLGKRLEIKRSEVERVVFNEETGEEEIINEVVEEEFWIGENPFKYFVGHPTKTKDEGSYGCYAHPIEVALIESGVPCTNISGCSVDDLYNYIKQGKPVIVWGRIYGWDLKEGVKWIYPDESGEYLELVGEHCFVLIGFDENYVYLNDPTAGAGVKQPKNKFEKNWHILYDQALIVDSNDISAEIIT